MNKKIIQMTIDVPDTPAAEAALQEVHFQEAVYKLVYTFLTSRTALEGSQVNSLKIIPTDKFPTMLEAVANHLIYERDKSPYHVAWKMTGIDFGQELIGLLEDVADVRRCGKCQCWKKTGDFLIPASPECTTCTECSGYYD